MKTSRKTMIISIFVLGMIGLSLFLVQVLNKDYQGITYRSENNGNVQDNSSIEDSNYTAINFDYNQWLTDEIDYAYNYSFIVSMFIISKCTPDDITNNTTDVADAQVKISGAEVTEDNTGKQEITDEQTIYVDQENDRNLQSNNNQETDENWIQAQIDENRELIDEGDLAAGTSIYNKIDMNYLFSLSEGGLTDEEKVEVKDYLHSVLTNEEYETMIVLFNKYIGLVN